MFRVRLIFKTTAALFGVFVGMVAITSGEIDDSPGLQGLGLILILYIGFRYFRVLRRGKSE